MHVLGAASCFWEWTCQQGLLMHAGLPKTRSGKIMRRILRKIAVKKDDELGDTSTLAEPSIVQGIIELRGK